MENTTDERKNKAKIWFHDLKKYAMEKKMPVRILDEIEECEEQLSSSDIDWKEINQTAEDLLESMEEKAYPKAMQQRQVVSIQAVEEQVKKMAQRCHAENITSVESMSERKNILLKKNYNQLMEISHAKAHLEEFKNEELFIQFFQNCKNTYEKDVMEMIRDMLQSIGNNYNHMLEHMKNMFQSIGGYKNGIGNEIFYREYEERRIGIDKKVQGEAQSSDVGGNDLLAFAQKTGNAVKGIVNKLVRKRKLLAWLPLILLLCIFVGSAIGNREKSIEVIESASADSNTDSDNNTIKEAAIKVGAAIIKKTALSKIMSIIESVITFALALVISLASVLIFLILLVIVLYWFYLKLLNVWCNYQICEKCGTYLKTELLRYTQNNDLSSKLDETMKNTMEEYERQYMIVLNNIFQNTPDDSAQGQNDEMSSLSNLREEWNKIIYE